MISQTGVAPPADPLARLRARGKQLFFGRGGCITCHKIGNWGTQVKGPNLGAADGMTEAIGVRGATRIGNLSAIEYIVASMVDPDGYVVKGYVHGIMKRVEEPPISMKDDEIVAIAVFLASVESNTTVTNEDVSGARMRVHLTRQFRAQRYSQLTHQKSTRVPVRDRTLTRAQ